MLVWADTDCFIFYFFLYLIILLIFVIAQSYSCMSAFSAALWLLAPGVISQSVRLLLIDRVIYHWVLMSYPSSLWASFDVQRLDGSSIFRGPPNLRSLNRNLLDTRDTSRDEFSKDHKAESAYLLLTICNTVLTPVPIGCFDPETNNGMSVTKAPEQTICHHTGSQQPTGFPWFCRIF